MLIFEDLEICLTDYFKPRLKLFHKLFGNRVIDVILHMPSYTIEKTFCSELSNSDLGKIIVVNAKVDSIDMSYKSSRPISVYARIASGQIIEILLFNYNKAYLKTVFSLGQQVCLSGKLNKSISGTFQLINPEKIPNTKIRDSIGLFNIYPLTTGIAQKTVYSVIKASIDLLSKSTIPEWIPENILQKNGFVSFYEALRNIHYPKEFFENQLDNPFRRRLAFDELLAEQLVIRLSNPKSKTGHIISNDKILIKKLLDLLSFKLTNAQKEAIHDIFSDMSSGIPMSRLLQGDVGSGKTIVALISALYAIESGYQVAILAPTEILARQHYNTIKSFFDQLGLYIELLTANEKGKKRKEILDYLGLGRINLIVGTHAIITDSVNFKNLGLVIVDEQHRFGVNQRIQLINKGITPHVLSMTATPIPRTVIMSLYGDIEVSSIKEKPEGRKEIKTKAMPLSKVRDLVISMKNIISQGQKIYWICPLIEESEKLRYTCVINRFNFLKEYFGDEVEMLHGKMKPSEKQQIFERFKNGNCNILVSTTVIEVGVDISNASVIIVENAEKFGLAQLHQLRGRVGRSDLQSYCILLYDSKLSEVAAKRINILRENADGFKVAEQDLVLRGGGEILGTKQSGQKTYKTFDITDPLNQAYIYPLLEQASTLATQIINSGESNNYQLLLRIFKKDNLELLKFSF